VILLSDQKREAADGDSLAAGPLTSEQLGSKFGDMTKNGGLSKRDAAEALAKQLGVSRNDVYRQLRAAGFSV
jgi:predicted transcriptional regulator YheO